VEVAAVEGGGAPLFLSLLISRSNCFTHLSAASALEPLYFAPLLSRVLASHLSLTNAGMGR